MPPSRSAKQPSSVTLLNETSLATGNPPVRDALRFSSFAAVFALSRPQRAHLDHTVACRRASRGPCDRGIQIIDVDQVVTANLFLGIDVRTIEHRRPAVLDPHRGRGRTRLK